MNGDNGTALVILLVEDEEIVRNFTVRALKRQGHDVLVAANAAEALVCSNERPRIDLLITDVSLPGMDGCELTRLFRDLHPKAAVIVTSGHRESEVLPAGATETVFLAKPFGFASLLEAIDRVVAATDR